MQFLSPQLLKRSRIRFWLYTAGPYLIGIASSGILRQLHLLQRNQLELWIIVGLIILYLRYFLFPANLLIYGINDIADNDTDLHNPKKGTYEADTDKSQQSSLHLAILGHTITSHVIGGIFLIILTLYGYSLQREFFALRGVFYLTSIFYSSPPIRAKAHPFIDGIFNILYCIPGLIGYLMLGSTRESIIRPVFLAGWIWSIAMHTYSAIPDITPDKKAGLTTTAVLLGKKRTHLYCGILWIIATILLAVTIPALMGFAITAGVIYIFLVVISYWTDPFKVYKLFPYINGIIGFILFWLIMFL